MKNLVGLFRRLCCEEDGRSVVEIFIGIAVFIGITLILMRVFCVQEKVIEFVQEELGNYTDCWVPSQERFP